VAEIDRVWSAAGRPEAIRLLFSAHGLPQQVVDGGDPYEAQIRATAAAIAQRLPGLPDWQVSFQSRVGRLKWLEPSTETAIRAAAAEAKGVLISPIAFVSEHVETLVELDHEYAELARSLGMTRYLRARTPGVAQSFIGALATAALDALDRTGVAPPGPWRCPAGHGKCPLREKA
jgi:ferrochelatase